MRWIFTSLFPWVGKSEFRGHRFKMRGKFTTQGGGYVYEMSCIPEEAAEVGTMTMFKRLLNKYMDLKGSEGYGPMQGNWVIHLVRVGLKGTILCCKSLSTRPQRKDSHHF